MTSNPILIVDDNSINLKLIKVMLSLEGYNVRTATDAKSALEVLAHFTPELILMDIQLPGMDGLELTRQLKANPKYQDVIILAITAYAMKGDEEKALNAGCDGYIAKPINTQTLPTLIKVYLSKGRGNE